MAYDLGTPFNAGRTARRGLGRAGCPRRSVRDEIRENLICRLRTKEPIFPGIIGYDETVVPQIVNAILSRHNFILLGLRGQAKSRILRALTDLLDPSIPVDPRLRDSRRSAGAAVFGVPGAHRVRRRRAADRVALP